MADHTKIVWDECSACTFERRACDCDICPKFPAAAPDVPLWMVCSQECSGCVDEGDCVKEDENG